MGSYTPSVSVGSIVDIMAEIDTKDGERILGIIDPWNTASVERKVLDSNWGLLPRPIGMGNNKALGGASVGNNPGIVGDPYGPYNIGSYVRVWGKVIESGTYQFEYDPYNATIPYMRIDDGSAVPSGNSVYGGPYGGQGITVFGTNTYNGYPTVDIGDYVAVTGVSSIWKPDGSDDTYRAIWAARDVQDLTASGSGYPPPNDTGTISGTVTLYDMTTSEVEVTLYSNFGKTETLTVSDGDNDHIGTASYSWTGIPLYDSQWGTARYMISAKADGYKTRTYTGITPWTDTATPKNFYLVPLRKIYLSTQDNRTYIGPCSPVSLNIGAMVLDDSHNPIEYDPNQPLNGGTVRFYTSAGSFHPTTLQQTITAHTNANGTATVTLYGMRWAGNATVSVTDDSTTPDYTDATTTDDTYKCDWETLPNTIAIHAPSVYVNLTANPTGISRCGSSYSTVTAHVSVCSGAPPVGSVVNFTIGENDPCVFVSTGTKSATATTDANGDATVQVRADDAHHFGTAYVTASTNIYAGSGSSSVSVTVAEYAAKVQVSANPTDVTSSGVSDIVFTARNASDQPLQGLQLNIRTTAGTLSNMNPSNGITDANGQVSVRLTLNSPPSAYVSAFYSDDCMGSVQTGIPIAYRQSAWKDVAVGFSSPLVADIITGDNGRPEIGIIGRDGYTHIWKANGSDWDEQTFDDMISLDFYGDNTLSAADVDGRGGLEVIAPASSSTEVYAFGYNGNSFAQMAGWPVNTNTGYQFLAVSAALADVNLDGANETVAGDHCCWVFSWNGTGEWDSTYGNSYLWKNLTGSSGASITGSSVAIGDLDSDVQSMPDAVVGANSELYSFPGDEWGDRTSPPLYTPGWETPRSAGGSVQSSPAIGDIDGDGKNDVAVGSSAGLSIYRSGNDSWTTYQYGSVVRSSPALADLDGDGNKDVVFGCNNGKVYAVKCDGTAIAGWEDGILLHEDYYSAYAVESSPAIADVVSGTSDATGKPEVIVGCNDGFLYAIYANGVLHTDSSGVLTGPVAAVWCCRAYEWDSSRVYSSPTVDDIDGNGHADIIVGSEAGMWRFEVPVTFNRTDTIRYPWPTYHYDAARTGCITTPASPIYSSIVGQVRDTSGNLAIGAEVYIYFQSDATTSTVPVPKSSPVTYRTGAVKSVGNTGRTEINRGGYSINQLQPSGQTYKIKVVYGGVTKWKQNITLTSGLNIIDLNMSQL